MWSSSLQEKVAQNNLGGKENILIVNMVPFSSSLYNQQNRPNPTTDHVDNSIDSHDTNRQDKVINNDISLQHFLHSSPVALKHNAHHEEKGEPSRQYSLRQQNATVDMLSSIHDKCERKGKGMKISYQPSPICRTFNIDISLAQNSIEQLSSPTRIRGNEVAFLSCLLNYLNQFLIDIGICGLTLQVDNIHDEIK